MCAKQRLSSREGGLVSSMHGDAGRSITINGQLTANGVGLARQPGQLISLYEVLPSGTCPAACTITQTQKTHRCGLMQLPRRPSSRLERERAASAVLADARYCHRTVCREFAHQKEAEQTGEARDNARSRPF